MRFLFALFLFLSALPCYAASGTITEWKLWTTSSGGIASQVYILPPTQQANTKFVVDLSALQLLPAPNLTSGVGFVAQTASNTYAARTLVAGSGITITNPTGAAGNPTIAATGGGVTSVTASDSSLTISPTTGAVLAAVTSHGVGTAQLDLELIQHSTITLTANQVKTLNSIPVQIAAAPGAGLVIIPFMWSDNLTYNSIPYAANTSMLIAYHGSSAALGSTFGINNASSTTNFNQCSLNANAYTTSSNKAVDITVSGGDPTSGDSLIRVDFWYAVIHQP